MGKLFCFLGASGSGKSSIQHSLPIKFLTHYTTRAPRDGEIDGYHIMHKSTEEYLDLMKEGKIATHTVYAGNYYGSPMDSLYEIMYEDIPYHATTTIESIEQFKKILGEDNVVVIYIKPPSSDALFIRMRARGDSYMKIAERMAHMGSAKELENEKYADYVIINDDLEIAKSEALNIVLTKTK